MPCHSNFTNTWHYEDDAFLRNKPSIWISSVLLEKRPPALRPLRYPSHILPVEFPLYKRIFKESSVRPQQTSFSKWHLWLNGLQMQKSRKQSHSFCLPVTLWSVLPFFLHFLLGNQFLGKLCDFFKTWYHVLLFITALACESRGFIWGHRDWWNYLLIIGWL